jgi:hypothetical protein
MIIWGDGGESGLWELIKPLAIGLIAVAVACGVAWAYGAWR